MKLLFTEDIDAAISWYKVQISHRISYRIHCMSSGNKEKESKWSYEIERLEANVARLEDVKEKGL